MKTFEVEKLANDQGGEYVLGMKDLHTHACYMVYGVLKPNETDRLVKPGEGHEEILVPVTGPVHVSADKGDFIIEQGSAVHIKEDESFFISNKSDNTIVYVLSGGHCREHHHH
jgi:redox-sensitive bicupin YhaK (pirin superfamily)